MCCGNTGSKTRYISVSDMRTLRKRGGAGTLKKKKKKNKLQGNLSPDILIQKNKRKKRKKINLSPHSQCTFTKTPFITAECRTCTLWFGTAQDIPAGVYQPKFQDTVSLSYGATEPNKNTYTHTHTHTHTRASTHTSTLTTETSLRRQK